MIQGFSGEQPVNFFIDSGATISLVSQEFVNRMKLNQYVQYCDANISSISNHKIHVDGKINLPLTIAGLTTKHNLIVTNVLKYDILLGMDFLGPHNVSINMGTRRLYTNRGYAPFILQPFPIKGNCKIRVNKTIIIKPNTINHITCSIWGGGRVIHGNFVGCVDQKNNLAADSGLFVANSICYSNKGLIPVQFTYVGNGPMVLYKNKIIGNFTHPEIVENVCSHEQESNNQSRPHPDPEVLYKKLNLEGLDLTPAELTQFKALITKHKDIFSVDKYDIGLCSTYRANIELKKDFTPQWAPSHKIPYKLREEMELQISNLLEAKVIEPCPIQSLWNSPVFLVKKREGRGWRFVCDHRRLNSMTLPDSYELPDIGKIFDEIGECKFFTSLDITSSFNTIEYEHNSRHLTAFLYNNRQYQFRRLVMGHRNSPSSFVRMLSQLFRRVPFPSLIYYIDDFLLATKNVDDHIERLDYVLSKLKEAGLKISPEKTKLLQKEVKFVGHIISERGIRIDEDRITPILNLQPPTTVKQLQSLLGTLNYCRKFLRHFAKIAKPLYALLQKGKKFVWNTECQTAFDNLKKALTESPVLAVPDLADANESFVVHTDSSKLGFGAILTQEIDGERRVIAYFSKSMPRHWKNIPASKMEFLGLYLSLKHWHHFLAHRKFTVKTDCSALVNMDKLFLKGKSFMQRQINSLACYNMTIVHVSGKSNIIPDMLSRYPFQTSLKHVSTQTALDSVNSFSLSNCHNTGSENGDKIPVNLDTGHLTGIALPECHNTGYKSVEKLPNNTSSISLDEAKIPVNLDTGHVTGITIPECRSTGYKFVEKLPSSVSLDEAKIPVNFDTGHLSGIAITEGVCTGSKTGIESPSDHISVLLDEAELPNQIDIGQLTGKTIPNRHITGSRTGEHLESPIIFSVTTVKFIPILDMIPEGETEIINYIESSDENYITADEHTENFCIKDNNILPILAEDPLDGLEKLFQIADNEHISVGDNRQISNTGGDHERENVSDKPHIVYDDIITEKPVPLITLTDIQSEQQKDPTVHEVCKWFESGKRPQSIQAIREPRDLVSYYKQFGSLKFENGILYRKWVNRNDPDTILWLIVVPFLLQEPIMRQYHNSVSLCHSGVEACIYHCTRTYYWPKLREDFTLYIRGCVKCGQNRQPLRYMRAPLNSMVFNTFGAGLGIDHIIMNNGRPTPRGFTCVLSMTDMWSGYVVLANCKGQTAAETINHIIKEWCMRLGFFEQVIHDLHPNFTSKLFTRICEVFDIKNTRTTRYYCKSNGKSESSNKKVGSLLRGVIPRNDLNNWDKYVLPVMSAINSLRSSKTGFSPNFLLYGKELPFCHEFMINYGTDKTVTPAVKPTPAAVKANELYRRMKNIHYKVRKYMNAKALYAKRVYDRRAKGPYFSAGDYCMILIEPKKTKLGPRWFGPVYIKSKVSDSLYVVEMNAEEGKFELVNIEKMKRFKPSKWTKTKAPKPSPKIHEDLGKQTYISSSGSSSSSDDYLIVSRTPNAPVGPDHSDQNTRGDGRSQEVSEDDPRDPPYRPPSRRFEEIPPRPSRPSRNPAPITRLGIQRENI